MATQTSYPGVYIEELPSAVRTITAVTTSVTAFVGSTRRGPLDKPVTITGFADFERQFGGLDAKSPVSYAVSHFFTGGGTLAVIVRVANAAQAASVSIPDQSPQLVVTAQDASEWANGLRIAIDPGDNDQSFGLRVIDPGGVEVESFRNLWMEPTHPRFVESVVNPSSGFVQVDANGTTLPPPSGTVSSDLSGGIPDLAGKTLRASVDDPSVDPIEITPVADGATEPDTVARLALLLERAIRSASTSRAFARARVNVFGGRLQVVSGTPDTTMTLTDVVANDLGLTSAQANAYALGGGSDGQPPELGDFLGSEADKTGIQALRDVADVNLLALPDIADSDRFSDDQRLLILAAAEELCVDKRMFLIVDSPSAWDTLEEARAGIAVYDSIRSNYAAIYFPHIQLTDPLTGQLRSFPPSGAVAGIMARTDGSRGVWKAPAGTEARLSGVRALTVTLTDPENGLLNPIGVNCLRSFPIIGPVVWGARTLEGADALASQWKYVPVRRLALMIEESLYRGTQWVVFEPNDEPLWGQIRLNVGAFMDTLFRQGAFQGTTAREAFFVKVDKETTTQDDINRGIVNILVGFAPLKPAEFVIIKIEQLAGQLEV
ncbi:phage tail sheath C-terminal domain-containing protein [Flindersiella endophytica]